MGWLPAGPVLVRLDVAERIAGELAYLTRRAPAPPPHDLASRLGVKADALGSVLGALGFRLLEPAPLAEDAYGPPTPLRVAQLRARPQTDRRGGWREGQGAGPRQQRRGPPGAAQGAPGGGKWQRGPGEARNEGRGQRRHGAPPGGDAPQREGAATEQAQEQGRPPRRDHQRPGGGEGPRQDRQHQGGGPRQDRRWPERRARQGEGGPQDGPPRRDGGGQPGGGQGRQPPREKAPDPDSPFAILAQLKLR
jgi:ATP-dependent RNA helicase SUPV3L1/SUV3